MRKHRFNIFKSFIVLVFCTLLLSGCKTKSEELVAMLESSISTAELTTGLEINRSKVDRGTKFGKPVHPEVRIQYKPIDNYTKEDVYEEIIEILEEGHWVREELSINLSGFYRASLQQDGFIIRATIKIQSERNSVSVRLRTIPIIRDHGK